MEENPEEFARNIPEFWSTEEWEFIFNEELRRRILGDPAYGLWLAKAFQVHATRIQARKSIHPNLPWPSSDTQRLSKYQSIVTWWFDVAIGIDPTAYRVLLDATVDIYVFGDTSAEALMRWRDALHACYGLFDRAKVLIDSGQITLKPSEDSKENRPSANAMMLDRMIRDPESKQWTLKQWSDAIRRSPSTIQQTPAWKEIMAERESQKEYLKGRSTMPYDR